MFENLFWACDSVGWARGTYLSATWGCDLVIYRYLGWSLSMDELPVRELVRICTPNFVTHVILSSVLTLWVRLAICGLVGSHPVTPGSGLDLIVTVVCHRSPIQAKDHQGVCKCHHTTL